MIPLPKAQSYAAQIVAELSPHCHRIEVAGSIRRGRPQVGDVDIVCIPKLDEQKDMFGHVMSSKNQVIAWAERYVSQAPATAPKSGEEKPRIISGGEGGRQLIVQLRRCQLDLWFATEDTWSTILLQRTGSAEHNIWLAQRALDRDGRWHPYLGLWLHGLPVETPTEEAIYAALGLQFIFPENRELPWIRQHPSYQSDPSDPSDPSEAFSNPV